MFFLYYELMDFEVDGPEYIGSFETLKEAWDHVKKDHEVAMDYYEDLLPWNECPRLRKRENGKKYVSTVFEIPETLPENKKEPMWVTVHKEDTFFVVQEEW